MLLAEDDADAVVRACQVAAQGQHWQPNMFIYTLQKRHSDNETICDLVTQLLKSFAERMPITSPIHLDSPQSLFTSREGASQEGHSVLSNEDTMRGDPGSSPHRRTQTLPSLGSPKTTSHSPTRTLHSPITTMSSLYMEEPSPYATHMRLPITRPPTSPLEQSRRSRIFSTPKLAAVDGDKQRRCRTPNAKEFRPNHFQLAALDAEASDDLDPQAHKFRSLDPLDGSPPRSPRGDSLKKRVVLSEKYSWNPECINSVSGFEWWWRSLPQNHANLEPTQKLKMVTKAAVRLHTKGDWERAIELYQLSLSMEINAEVEFRLRINLACAYEASQELSSSIQAFRAALELNSEDPYARFKLGEVLGATGEFTEARKLFESVSSAYPQASDALMKLQQAETLHIQEGEAKRAATAAAKVRRSLSKKKQLQQEQEEEKLKATAPGSMTQPVAPSSPATSSPASRRTSGKLKKSTEQASPRVDTESADSKEVAATDLPAAPVDTVADGADSLLDTTSHGTPRDSSEVHSTNKNSAPIDPSCSSAELSDRSASHHTLLEIRSEVSVASVGIMAQVSTASVGTVTDECEPQASLLDLLVERCADMDIDLRQYLLQIVGDKEGLIRLDTFAEMVRLLCGAAFRTPSGSFLVTKVQQALPDDACVRHGQHTFVRHRSVLAAWEAKMRRGRLGMREVESSDVNRDLQELAKRETLFFVRFLAETSTGLWMQEGAQRAAGNEKTEVLNPSAAVAAKRDMLSSIRYLAETSTDSWTREGVQRAASNAEKRGMSNRSAADLAHEPAAGDSLLDVTKGPRSTDVKDQALFIPQDRDGEEHDPLGGELSEEGDKYAMDGYTALSPRLDTKREKARQEQILRREKSRIFARKHIHCLRSLRELAAHARTHHVARCEAREFLAQVARDAREKLGMQTISDGDESARLVSNTTASSLDEDLQLQRSSSKAQPVERASTLVDVSQKVYTAAVEAAVRNVVAAGSCDLTLSQLQSLAHSYATLSQVPPLLQEVCTPAAVVSSIADTETEPPTAN